MSAADRVPETWELSGDDAWETLRSVGRARLLKDAVARFRHGDGSSHSRSMAYMVTLVLLEGIIGLVGLAAVVGSTRFGNLVSAMVEDAVPGPAGRTLTDAVRQAQDAATTGQWIGLVLGLTGAIVTGTLLMAQFERAVNRLYGIEEDRPTAERYVRAFVLAATAGVAIALGFAMLAFGRSLADEVDRDMARSLWSVLRWPGAVGLLIAAIALMLRWAPRRRQPAWSWLAFGATLGVAGVALASLALGQFFRWSSTFGETYGPLAGTIALLLWAGLSSTAVLFGAAVAAELEAVRATGLRPTRSRAADPEPALR